ncbi:hypothetical protein pb186bvf_012925 [Paramecium bursaria]
MKKFFCIVPQLIFTFWMANSVFLYYLAHNQMEISKHYNLFYFTVGLMLITILQMRYHNTNGIDRGFQRTIQSASRLKN